MFKRNRLSSALVISLMAGSLSVGHVTASSPASEATVHSNSATLTSQSNLQSSFLGKLVAQSDLIFKGKLIEISEAMSIEEIPYTFVTYQVQETIAGTYNEDSITLKFVGGTFANGNRLSATNSPSVNLGEEAILMVQRKKDTGCDFVECEHGRFLIEDGMVVAANESAILVDEQGGLDFVSLAARQKGEFAESLKQSNLPAFTKLLKSLDQSASQLNKTAKKQVVSLNPQQAFPAYPGLTRAMAGPKVPTQTVNHLSQNAPQNDKDAWEEAQLKMNGGNPLLDQRSENQ